MRSLNRRLADLEASSSSGLKRWHRIIQYEGETDEHALAAYEAKHGPIGPDDGSILRVIIRKPFAESDSSNVVR